MTTTEQWDELQISLSSQDIHERYLRSIQKTNRGRDRNGIPLKGEVEMTTTEEMDRPGWVKLSPNSYKEYVVTWTALAAENIKTGQRVALCKDGLVRVARSKPEDIYNAGILAERKRCAQLVTEAAQREGIGEPPGIMDVLRKIEGGEQ